MVNYSHILRTRWFIGSVFAAIFFLITLSFTKAQTACPPDPGGGVRYRAGLDFTSAHTTNFYPQSVPAGQNGDDRSTTGSLIMTQPVTTVFPSNVVSIRPVLDNGKTGSVVLNFKYMSFGDAPNAVLKIYQGISTAVPPTVTITAANAATYPGSSLSYAGPVTIQFESPTPGTSGNFNIDIRFFTGDQVFNSSFGRKAAVWTDFVQPNSYTFIDDQRGTTPNPPYSDNWNPIDIAYFDANRQFVSADRSYCLDSPRNNVGMGFLDYPGKTVFTSYTNFDIDRSGTINDTDKLKMARLAWLMANRTTVPLGDLRGVQEEVWSIVNSGGGGGSETAVPTLPSPAEPTFSISAGVSPVDAGTASTFTVSFDMTGSAAKRLKLVVPGGVTIASVSGAGVSYSGGFLNFASLPATATIQAVSAAPQTAQLQVIYEETGFWNVSNLKVYQPCDNGGSVRQDFIGWSQGTIVYPHREASATWQELDYGDLPSSYTTDNASNGPSHVISAYDAGAHTASLMLGSQIDGESDGIAGGLATGDDLAGIDDEDAITKFPVLVPGSTSYSVTLAVTNTTGANATVKGWIDFNKDGAFGAGEEATQTVSNGGTSVTLTWSGFPAVATFGYTYARFRIASVASEIASPTGLANSGEVEDYRLFIGRTVAGSVFNDSNRNTRIDSGEPFTSLPAPLFVYMVHNNTIVDAATVATNGSYLLLAPSGQTSTIHLSTLQYPIGTDISTNPINRTPPVGWVTTGENVSGNNTGNGDFLPDGMLSVTVTTASLTNRNFGITCNSAGTSGGYDICASEKAVLPLSEFITGEDAGGIWTYLTGSGITFDAIAGTVQLTSTATTSTYRYDVPATANCAGSSSIATVRVRQLPITYQSVTICEGGSVCIANPAGTARLVDPQTQICHTTSGVFTDTLLTAGQYGCDSIVVTTVTVVPTPNAGTDGSVAACNNSTTPIDLFSLITGEQTGGSWARLTGTGGTFDAVSGTYTPAVGATNSTFSYTVTSAGSCGSDISVATVNLNLCIVQISGSVLNDDNGLAGTPSNTVDGLAIQSASGMQLHANLFTSAGVFVETVPINASGNYTFSVAANANYLVTISATPGAIGSTPESSVSLPTSWKNTGENVGTGVGSDGVPDGILAVSVGTISVSNANFGIDHEPNSNSLTHVLATQPAVDDQFNLDGTDAPVMSGADPEDGTYSGSDGSVNSPQGVIITSMPTNGELWYYGFGFPVRVSATDVVNKTLFDDPSLFSMIMTGSGYTNTTFGYAYVDAAGIVDSTPATYTISWDDPLPVKLISFVARLENNVANLSWSTTEEVNSDFFEVQHSPDAKNWTVLGSVIAEGNSSVKKDYNYGHAGLSGGLNYYRLKMVDKDGTFAMSSIRSVRLDNFGKATLYPNPASDFFLLKDLDPGMVKSIKILNIAGLVVWQNEGAQSGQVTGINLADGLYVVYVEKTDGGREILKLVVKK